MYEDKFVNRLIQLRNQKGISARDMSLSIGQNPGYINNIETGKSLPSMSCFFYICEYLGITPKEFFNFESSHPKELDLLCDNLNKLSEIHFKSVCEIVNGLAGTK